MRRDWLELPHMIVVHVFVNLKFTPSHVYAVYSSLLVSLDKNGILPFPYRPPSTRNPQSHSSLSSQTLVMVAIQLRPSHLGAMPFLSQFDDDHDGSNKIDQLD